MTTTNGEPERRPILFITIGRQRVGKTTTLNTIVQFVHARGGRFVVWNGDRLNQTYNLAQFHKDVVEPPTAGFDEVQVWLEDRIRDQVQHGYDAVLDIGGGETPLNRLMEELPFVQSLERRGIRVVVAHIVGPEKADLDYLSHFSGHQLAAPEATLIVLNAGLVMSGRSAANAFAAVREHKAFQATINQGARVAMMPLLSCMSQVTDRGLTFAEAINGVTKPGLEPLSFFDQERVAIWWEKNVPGFFGMIPPLWLPAMTTPEEHEAEKAARTRRGKANGADRTEGGEAHV